jgi:bacillithiol biosynthesis deacetylase BshB1
MRILAFGIHPDDVELGCGGSVILAARQGHEVSIVDLTEGHSSTNGSPEERAAEGAEAARLMGVARRKSLGLPDTRLRSESDEQLGAVVECVRDERPDLVFIPSADDPHPDHASGSRLIGRALYFSGVGGYQRERPSWRAAHSLVYPGRVDFEPDVVVDVTPVHDAKIKAILAHASQFVPGEHREPTPLNAPEFIESLSARARLHGARIGVRFGEAFRTVKPIGLEGFGIFGNLGR